MERREPFSKMNVRAKFYVNSVTLSKWGPDQETLHSVKLSPVMGNAGPDENKTFWKYTPTGSIELGTVNASAGAAFEIGKSYYVDFSPAP
jgi:hypothetical protein